MRSRCAIMLLAMTAFGACSTTGNHESSASIDGPFRGRWWSYYERGRAYAETSRFTEAEADLRLALADRAEDQRWARTYGLHFIPEYFPNRELGVVLFEQARDAEAEPLLVRSIEQEPSARAAYYLGQVRERLVRASGADASPPRIEILAPSSTSPLADLYSDLKLRVSDDSFVESVTVNGQGLLPQASNQTLDVSHRVALVPGQNEILISAIDVAGNEAEAGVTVEVDVDGPAISLQHPFVFPGVLAGLARDSAGVSRISAGGLDAELLPLGDGGVAFHLLLTEVPTVPLELEAFDAMNNVTRTRITPDLITTAAMPGEYVFAGEGPRIIFAAEPIVGAPLEISFANLAPDQRYLKEEIIVTIEARSTSSIASLTLQGQEVPVLLPDSHEQRISRRIRLVEAGPHIIEATVSDANGNEANTQVTVERALSSVEATDNKLSVALLGNVWESINPESMDETGFVLDEMQRKLYEARRFDLLSRDALPQVLQEQELLDVIGNRNERPLGGVIPADLVVVGRLRRTGTVLEIILQAVSTENSRIVGYADVAGPASSLDELRALVSDLTLRFDQEFPRVEGTILQVASGTRVRASFSEHDRIRRDLPGLVFRRGEEIIHPATGARLGAPIDLVAEGRIEEVQQNFSTVTLEQAATVEVTDFVITK